jgi:GNAT superfamily N-acetyltransferase
MGKLSITRATLGMIDEVVPLFDAYRQFYAQVTDFEGARNFLTERLAKNESVIFLASEDGRSLGFTQLYPSFSSVSMQRTWILNDLFVYPNARGHGVAGALIERAKQFALETNVRELSLETAKTNLAAQDLYKKCGWKRDELFYKYELLL